LLVFIFNHFSYFVLSMAYSTSGKDCKGTKLQRFCLIKNDSIKPK
jgi:hypothetical protein